jgi:hypothetical protein
VTQTTLDQIEYTRPLQILGVIPIGRRFEAIDLDTNEFISGKVGPSFSQDYLERVNRGEVEISGRRWLGVLQRKTTTRSDRKSTVMVTLLDLQPVEDQLTRTD